MVADAGPVARYAAFISYSHRDQAAARRLHRRLENYRMPRRLAGTPGEHGPVPARLTPIFRDRDELPAAGDLSATVRAALAVSDHLVVLCSPDSAASPWVAREIAVYRELHPDRPILAAVVAGEPGACFPAPLTEGSVEPLAADLRAEGDGQRMGFLKLVAGLAGVRLDALVQRDAARQIRRVTAVTLVAVAAMLAMAVLTSLAIDARREAERQRAEAEGLVEYMLTDLRTRLKGVGRTEVLTSVNQRALDYYGRQNLPRLPADSLERRARVLHAMGEDDETRGDLGAALARFKEAEQTTARLIVEKPNDPERLFDHVQSQYWIGRIAEARGNNIAALHAYRDYLAQAERLNRLKPGNPKYVGELAYAEKNLGSLALLAFEKPDEARGHFQRALGFFDAAARLEPRNPLWTVKAADTHAWIADSWFNQGRHPEARRERLAEQALKQRLLDQDPENREHRYALVITVRSLARVDMAQKHYVAAGTSLLAARATMSALLAEDGDNLRWRDQATRIEGDLADLFIQTGRLDRARTTLANALALYEGKGRPRAEPSAARARVKARLDDLSRQLRRLTSR